MDLSGIIFVALAVAWAVYLVPKALKHHDEAVRDRSVDRFSHTMRVLARREPVGRREARLVVTPRRAESAPVVPAKHPPPSPAQLRARRQAARLAAKRRRRVLGVLVLALVTVGALAAFGVVHWGWTGVPAGLVVGWLVLCRLMVKGEARADRDVLGAPAVPTPEEAVDPLAGVPEDYAVSHNEQGFAEVAAEAPTSSTIPVADPDAWDPMPVTLPTYVTKDTAARTVRTIDLESTGVWTSGRTDEDAAIARQVDAERAECVERDVGVEDVPRRAVGS